MARGSAKWNDTRVIIFTEYDDTRRYLQQQLQSGDRWHGSSGEPNRHLRRIDARIFWRKLRGTQPPWIFGSPSMPDPQQAHPIRILIATDAAREGLNLQAHCWNLFHFDVPWNPSRMEQRNGRIDRKLQPA